MDFFQLTSHLEMSFDLKSRWLIVLWLKISFLFHQLLFLCDGTILKAVERHLYCKTAIFYSQVILKLNLVTTYNNPAKDACFVNEHWNWSETTIFDVWDPIRIFLSWTSYSLLARQVSLFSYFVLYSILSIRWTVTVLCSVGILLLPAISNAFKVVL